MQTNVSSLTESQRELSNLVKMRHSTALNYMQQNYYADWSRTLDYFLGDQWKNLPKRKVQLVINHIFKLTSTVTPILLSMLPEIYILNNKVESEFGSASSVIQDYIQAGNDNGDRLLNHESLSTMRCLYGNGFNHTRMDLEEGTFSDEAIAPWNIFVEPHAKKLSDARWVIKQSFMPKDEVEFRYKDYSKRKILAAIDSAAGSVDFTDNQFEEFWNYMCMDMGLHGKSKDDTIPVFEMTERPTPKSPYGRFITLIGSYPIVEQHNFIYANVRAAVNASIIAPCSKSLKKLIHPYQHYTGYGLDNRFWGIALARPAREIQDIINQVTSMIVENALGLATGKWFKEVGSGVQDRELTDTTGDVIKVNRGTKVWQASGAPLPFYVNKLLADLNISFDDISGVHSVTGGGTQGNVISANAMELLKSGDHSRLSTIIRKQDKCEKERAELIVKMIQLYSDPGQTFEYVTSRKGEDKPVIDRMIITDSIKNGDYRVELGSQAQLPLSSTDKFRFYLSLGEAGMIDGSDVLRKAGIPGTESIIRRMEDKKKSDGAIQAMAQVLMSQGMEDEEVFKRLQGLDHPQRGGIVSFTPEANKEITAVFHTELLSSGLGDSPLAEMDFMSILNLGKQDAAAINAEELRAIANVKSLYGIGTE